VVNGKEFISTRNLANILMDIQKRVLLMESPFILVLEELANTWEPLLMVLCMVMEFYI